MSDDAIRKIIGNTNSSWVDYSDKSTWYEDEALTKPAMSVEDVRYVKDKVNGSAYRITQLHHDGQGDYYVTCNPYDESGARLFNEMMIARKLNPQETTEIERRFMKDFGIHTCPPCNNNCNQGRDCPNRRTK